MLPKIILACLIAALCSVTGFTQNKAIFEAAGGGDIDKVRELLDADPLLISAGDKESGASALLYAASGGQLDVENR